MDRTNPLTHHKTTTVNKPSHSPQTHLLPNTSNTFSTHHINTSFQFISYQPSLSTQPLNPPSQPTLSPPIVSSPHSVLVFLFPGGSNRKYAQLVPPEGNGTRARVGARVRVRARVGIVYWDDDAAINLHQQQRG